LILKSLTDTVEKCDKKVAICDTAEKIIGNMKNIYDRPIRNIS